MRLMVLRPQGPIEHFFGRALERIRAEVVINEKTKVRDVARLRPGLVVATTEFWRNRAACVAEANRLGIPTLYVMDGILEWRHSFENDRFWPGETFLQPLACRKIAAPGASAARLLADWGYGERVEVVGLARLDHAREGFARRPAAQPTLLVVTPNAWWLNEAHRGAVETALGDLVQHTRERTDLAVRWRVQPELAAQLGIETRWELPLYDELAEVHAVVGPATTVLLEAMALDLPVACLDYQLKPQLTRFAWTIAHAGAIAPTLAELLAPEPRRMAFQRQLADDQLAGGSAETRLVALFERLLAAGGGPTRRRLRALLGRLR